METREAAAGGGIGLSGVLCVALIILKATGTIGMSWFWVVTSVIWIPVIMFVGIIVLFLGIALVALLMAALFNKL